MKLVKSKSKREGYEKYTDLSLVFKLEGKDYSVRVRPVFWQQMGLLKSVAKEDND